MKPIKNGYYVLFTGSCWEPVFVEQKSKGLFISYIGIDDDDINDGPNYVHETVDCDWGNEIVMPKAWPKERQ